MGLYLQELGQIEVIALKLAPGGKLYALKATGHQGSFGNNSNSHYRVRRFYLGKETFPHDCPSIPKDFRSFIRGTIIGRLSFASFQNTSKASVKQQARVDLPLNSAFKHYQPVLPVIMVSCSMQVKFLCVQPYMDPV